MVLKKKNISFLFDSKNRLLLIRINVSSRHWVRKKYPCQAVDDWSAFLDWQQYTQFQAAFLFFMIKMMEL